MGLGGSPVCGAHLPRSVAARRKWGLPGSGSPCIVCLRTRRSVSRVPRPSGFPADAFPASIRSERRLHQRYQPPDAVDPFLLFLYGAGLFAGKRKFSVCAILYDTHLEVPLCPRPGAHRSAPTAGKLDHLYIVKPGDVAL